ncbi:hypothetical protein [Methylobacterium gnaphalii]|uniref:Uncharacterized protein n=1 Tax=Methylobacterium gnaphalii TaxID=1010610 RepID=A0A512JRP4_9HYPH|nr:hypothetical protein [Methylobacterium gnaphalii]GEP12634.1 hypothetical protein MGN01_44790 [Methylobacterium gnaphalii]GJD71781.1 hypothetical protein MMMDOFMJ_4746 [Methylobacterium gnaphalii]GLS48932.1 hypothetical protein GCM10007885_17790 [Methylobacterium gnaphalii]
MPKLSPDDAEWFAATRETHRIRPATAEETATFRVRKPGFDKLMTVVRAYDGAQESYAFQQDDPVDRAMDCELAGWFDTDLDASVVRPENGC